MALVLAYQNRALSRNIVIKDASDVAITPGVADVVRVQIGREGETEKLTVTSGVPTANGSTLVKGSTNVLVLTALDLVFEPGTYTMKVDLFDAADGQWKNVDRQVFRLMGT
jgi:hypothetical protein